MKKQLLLFYFVLVSLVGYGQKWGSTFFVETDSSLFGKSLSVGTLIADKSSHSMWMVTAHANSDKSLLTASVVPILSDSLHASGLWVLSEGDIVPQDSSLNVEILGTLTASTISCDTIQGAYIDLGYDIYVALLTQTGSDAPVATVLQNSIGTITWTVAGIGSYYAAIPGYDTSKIVVFIGDPSTGNPNLYNIAYSNPEDSGVHIYTGTLPAVMQDGILKFTVIEIRKYH